MSIKRLVEQSGVPATLVLWDNPINDGYGGLTFDDPIEIRGRWEDKQELFVNLEGKELVSQAVVYIDQDVEVGSYLFQGELTDLDSGQDAQTQSGAHQVKAFSKISDIKGTIYIRKVWI